MLLDDDNIEVIAIRNGKYWKTIMAYRQWKSLIRKKGYRYLAYELGYSAYILEN